MLLLLPCAVAHGQTPATRVTLTASLTAVDFTTFGGRFGAAAVQLGLAHPLGAALGTDLAAFAVAPGGGASATPGCVQGSACQSRTTPSLLAGLLITPFARLGTSGVRLAAGGAYVRAIGGEGGERRASPAGVVAVDWLPVGRSRLTPTAGVRVVRFASTVMGARFLVLPGVGLAF